MKLAKKSLRVFRSLTGAAPIAVQHSQERHAALDGDGKAIGAGVQFATRAAP